MEKSIHTIVEELIADREARLKESGEFTPDISAGRLYDFNNFDIDTMVDNIYVINYDDEYHRVKTDGEKQVMGIRSQYTDIEEYYEALDKYRAYIASIMTEDNEINKVGNGLSIINQTTRMMLDGSYDLLVPNEPRFVGAKADKAEFDETGSVVRTIFGKVKNPEEQELITMKLMYEQAMSIIEDEGTLKLAEVGDTEEVDSLNSMLEGLDTDTLANEIDVKAFNVAINTKSTRNTDGREGILNAAYTSARSRGETQDTDIFERILKEDIKPEVVVVNGEGTIKHSGFVRSVINTVVTNSLEKGCYSDNARDAMISVNKNIGENLDGSNNIS